MNRLENLIKEKGTNFEYCFVFPNSISRQFCFSKALSILQIPTLPSECYISWNIFIKEHIAKDLHCEREGAGGEARLLYAEYIMAKNAKSAKQGSPILNALISAEYAEKSHSFSKWITSILPQLACFKNSKNYKDKELQELEFLANNYSEFLQKNDLFESHWEDVHFVKDEKKYIIIYPELIDDFEEYSFLLTNRDDVEFFFGNNVESEKLILKEFESSYLELKYIASEIEELLLNGEKISNIALSVVELEHMQSYVVQEFEKRGIPIDLYVRQPILQNRFATLFDSIKNVIESHYSFESIKKLLLNKSIQWKFDTCKNFIAELLAFGIKYNCAYSWQEGNVWKNVWEKAFANHSSEKELIALSLCFKEFKKKIESIYNATTFKKMEGAIKAFFAEYIDFSSIAQTDEKALSACLKILKNLGQMEVKFASYIEESKIHNFTFFLTILQTKTIHSNVCGSGLSIFPYGAACATFFAHHFVINANQKGCSTIRGKMTFLREDKRDAVGLKDVDLSKYFIATYSNNEHVSFSYSKKTYQGYRIANSMFKNIEKIEEMHKEDSFHNEEQYFFDESPILSIYKNQLEAMLKARIFDEKPVFSMLSEKYFDTAPELRDKMIQTQNIDGKFAVSDTRLSSFFLECPAKFFYSKILNIQKIDFSALMFDRRIIGRIYHLILEKIYKTIMETHLTFSKEKIDEYIEMQDAVFEEVLYNTASCYGPLSMPFMQAMQKQIKEAVRYVFSLDTLLFEDWQQYIVEGKYQNDKSDERMLKVFKDGILYIGRIDRALNKNDDFAILDYKTYSAQKDFELLVNDIKIKDFQMPFYVFLLEETEKTKKKEQSAECKKVKVAYFVELLKKNCTRVLKIDSKDVFGKTGGEAREDLEKKKEEQKIFYTHYKKRVIEGNFIPEKRNRGKCTECEYKHICRTTFFVGKRRI